MKRELICIVCPRGCHLSIDEKLNVTGNTCPRGAAYAKAELTNPTRTLTSTLYIESEIEKRCPVKSKDPLPKGKIIDCMRIINKTKIEAPVHIGDVVVKNILDTGVDIVATKDIAK